MISAGHLLSVVIAAIIAVIGYFGIKREGKNEAKYKNLEDELDELREIEQSKNDFNNLDASEQSSWMRELLKRRRAKAKKKLRIYTIPSDK